MKGVVVVGVVPIDRARGHEALLVGGGRISERLDRRLAHLWIVEVQFAVSGNDVLTSVSSQEIIERAVGIGTVGRDLKAKSIDVAHALLAQLFLYTLEEIVEGIPGLRDVLDRIAGLVDQRAPNMVGRHPGGVWYSIKAALFFDAVVARDREERGFGVLL